MTIKEAYQRGLIRVGSYVHLTCQDARTPFKGYIGEVHPTKFYVWQNEKHGGSGNIEPSSKGYTRSWSVQVTDEIGNIEFMDIESRTHIAMHAWSFPAYDVTAMSTAPFSHTRLESERITLTASTTKPMSNIMDYIKRIGLTADDKALLDAGLEDPSGVPTSTGLHVMQMTQWKKERADLAKLAQAMLDEQKAKKS